MSEQQVKSTDVTEIVEDIEGEEEYLPPAPDDVALAAMQGLLANPQYTEGAQNAVMLAWTVCVPAFFQGRQVFAEKIAPMWMNGLK